MSDDFWETCRSNNIGLNLTVYPPYENEYKNWLEICKNNNVKIGYAPTPGFNKFLNFNGKSDKIKNFKSCTIKANILKDGKIYICPAPAFGKYLNDYFKTNIPTPYTIDIYQKNLTKKQIIKALNSPVDTCEFCKWNDTRFKWDYSKKVLSEWDATVNT
ncbi:MAG: hypothetical protein SNJ71_00775 [Bacteroidales bacterium]